MSKFLLEIITPEKQFFKGEVESINIPSLGGACTIMAGHQPMVFATEPGMITIVEEGRKILTSAAQKRRRSAQRKCSAATAAPRNINSTGSLCNAPLRACASNITATRAGKTSKKSGLNRQN